MALLTNGSLVPWGDASRYETSLPPDLLFVSAASGGSYHNAMMMRRTDLGDQAIGAGKQVSLDVHNVGNGTLTIGEVTITGTNASDFTLERVEPFGTDWATHLKVTFKPSALGPRTAVLHIPSNAENVPSYFVTLAGNGLPPPEIAVFDGATTAAASERQDGGAPLTIATTAVGLTSPPRTFTIQNTGPGDLIGLAVRLIGPEGTPFSFTPPLATTLAPDETTTFTVSFTPTTTGADEAQIQIASNDADENPFDLTLRAIGHRMPTLADVEVSPTQTTATATSEVLTDSGSEVTERGFVFALTSTNDAPQIDGTGVTKLVNSGTGLGTFTGALPDLTPGGSYSICAYATSSEGTSYSAVATFTTLGKGEIAVFKGNSTAPADELTGSAASFSFANTLVGQTTTSTFTIKNTGNADLTSVNAGITGTDSSHFDYSHPKPPRWHLARPRRSPSASSPQQPDRVP